DADLTYSFRARAILTQEEPALAAYDQDAWAALPRPPFAELLDAFSSLRSVNLALIEGIGERDWERAGMHAERGRLSFRVLTETTAGHDIAHHKQLEQTIA